MKRRLLIGPAALRDIDEQVVYIGMRNFDAAERYERALHQDFAKLTEWPGLGTIREYPSPKLVGLRSWPVSGFGNYLIFYRPIEDGIEIVRVLHGARDVDQIFRRYR